MYCCSWWLLFAAVGVAVLLGAISVLFVILNSVSTEVAVVDNCWTILLVYGAISILSGLIFLAALCLCNCKWAFHHRPRLTAISIILFFSLILYIVGLAYLNYRYAPDAFGWDGNLAGNGSRLLGRSIESGSGVIPGSGSGLESGGGGSELESGGGPGSGLESGVGGGGSGLESGGGGGGSGLESGGGGGGGSGLESGGGGGGGSGLESGGGGSELESGGGPGSGLESGVGGGGGGGGGSGLESGGGGGGGSGVESGGSGGGGGGGSGGSDNGGGGGGGGSGGSDNGGESPVEVCISEIQGIRILIIASDFVFIILCVLCTLSVIFFSFFKKESPVVYYKHYR